jgi:hypothetical protein
MAKVTVKRYFHEMPPGAQIGDQIDADAGQLERWTRDGHVERIEMLTRPNLVPRPVEASRLPSAAPAKDSDSAQGAEYARVNAQRDKKR